MAGLARDGDPAQLGEGLDSRLAAEPAIARRSDAAERHLRFVLNRRAIDVTDARSNAARDLEPARSVAGEDGGGKAVFTVVGDADRFLLIGDADDPDHRAEAFVA